jgi:tight adherence protein B
MDGLLLIGALLLVLTALAGAAVAERQAAARRARRLALALGLPETDAAPARQRPLTGEEAPRLRDRLDALFGIERALQLPMGFRIWHAAAITLPACAADAWLATSFAGLPLPAAVPAVLVTAVLVPRLVYARLRRKAMDRLLDQFPDALGLVVRSVRAGIPVAEGIRAVATELPSPTGPEFRHIADDLTIGIPVEAALLRSARRARLPEYRFFAIAVALQRETGGNIGETLDNLAELIRKRRLVRQKAKALSAEARTSTYVLAALPFFALGALLVLNPDYVGQLFTTPEGKALLAAGILLLGTGLGTVQLLTRSLRP